MTSFGYRLNPRYAIKEFSSCGALYTRDCCCSKGNELEEDLVTHLQDFQNIPESSDDSTNVVNAPRDPFVVKQDHRSFVDKNICDLNKAPDSPHLHTFSSNQRHCFHCKDVLGDGESCQRCTCTRCGSGLSKGLCYICGNNHNSLNDSLSISENSPQSPPHINHHCCYECGDALDGIFCQRCTCKSCGKEEKQLEEEQAAKAQNWKLPISYDDDDDEESSNSLEDNIISELPLCVAITPTEPVDSLSMGDEHLDTISATELDEFIKSITPDFPIMESLIMENEHLDTIPKIKSDEFMKSSVENIVSIPSESEDFFDIESECDMPDCDDSQTTNFSTFSNPLFDDSTSSDDDDDSDSEGDTLSLERLLHDDPIPLSDTLDFSYDVRVFLPFFTYPMTSSILLSSGSEDIIFDHSIYHFSSLEPGLSHRCGTFKNFNTHRSHLNESPMKMLFSTFSPMDQ
nr:hypothetical protein [Tanacetum cinerariifolium]